MDSARFKRPGTFPAEAARTSNAYVSWYSISTLRAYTLWILAAARYVGSGRSNARGASLADSVPGAALNARMWMLVRRRCIRLRECCVLRKPFSSFNWLNPRYESATFRTWSASQLQQQTIVKTVRYTIWGNHVTIPLSLLIVLFQPKIFPRVRRIMPGNLHRIATAKSNRKTRAFSLPTSLRPKHLVRIHLRALGQRTPTLLNP